MLVPLLFVRLFFAGLTVVILIALCVIINTILNYDYRRDSITRLLKGIAEVELGLRNAGICIEEYSGKDKEIVLAAAQTHNWDNSRICDMTQLFERYREAQAVVASGAWSAGSAELDRSIKKIGDTTFWLRLKGYLPSLRASRFPMCATRGGAT
jgi:hypothetical protein